MRRGVPRLLSRVPRYRCPRVAVKTANPALLAAARELFATRGYADVEVADVTRRADPSGAEHFTGDKEELFRAVAVRVSADTAGAVRVAARQASGPWDALERGIEAFLDAATTTEVRQILLRDGPVVLGAEVWRAIDGDYAIGLVERSLDTCIEAGELPRQPARPAAYVLVGALEEAAMTIASAQDPLAARAEMARTVDRLLEGLRAPIA